MSPVTSVMRYFTHFGDTFVSEDYFDNRKPRLILSRIENDMQIELPTKWPALCVREMFRKKRNMESPRFSDSNNTKWRPVLLLFELCRI